MGATGAISTKALVAAGSAATAATGGAVATTVILNNKDTNTPPPTGLYKKRFEKKGETSKEHVRSSDRVLTYPGECIADYFDGFKWNPNHANTNDSTSYNPFTNVSNKKGKGCYRYNWIKKRSKEGKWRGELNWEWVFLLENKGIIFSAVAKNSSAEANKLDVSVKIAGLELKAEDKTWEVKYFKTNDETKVDTNAKQNKLPKGFKDDQTTNDTLGFEPDFGNICQLNSKDNGCGFDLDVETSDKYWKRGDWTEKPDGNNDTTYTDKFSNLDSNFEALWNSYKGQVDINGIKDRCGIWS